MSDKQKGALRTVLKALLQAVDTLDEASTFRNISRADLIKLNALIEELTA
jgi:hypothetical protein